MTDERTGGAPTQSTDATSTAHFTATHMGGDPKQMAITNASGERE